MCIRDSLPAEQADGPDGLKADGTGSAVNHLTGGGNPESGAQGGEQHNPQRQQGKEGDLSLIHIYRGQTVAFPACLCYNTTVSSMRRMADAEGRY